METRELPGSAWAARRVSAPLRRRPGRRPHAASTHGRGSRAGRCSPPRRRAVRESRLPTGWARRAAPHGGRPHGKTRPRGRREGALGRRASSGACDLGLRLTVRIITARYAWGWGRLVATALWGGDIVTFTFITGNPSRAGRPAAQSSCCLSAISRESPHRTFLEGCGRSGA